MTTHGVTSLKPTQLGAFQQTKYILIGLCPHKTRNDTAVCFFWGGGGGGGARTRSISLVANGKAMKIRVVGRICHHWQPEPMVKGIVSCTMLGSKGTERGEML